MMLLVLLLRCMLHRCADVLVALARHVVGGEEVLSGIAA